MLYLGIQFGNVINRVTTAAEISKEIQVLNSLAKDQKEEFQKLLDMKILPPELEKDVLLAKENVPLYTDEELETQAIEFKETRIVRQELLKEVKNTSLHFELFGVYAKILDLDRQIETKQEFIGSRIYF